MKRKISRIQLKYQKYRFKYSSIKSGLKIILFLIQNCLNIILLHINLFNSLIKREISGNCVLFIEPPQQGYGDLFFQTPIFELLKKSGYQVQILCQAGHCDILKNNQNINKILFWNKRDLLLIFKTNYKFIICLGRDKLKTNLLLLIKFFTPKYILDSNLKIWRQYFKDYNTPIAWQKLFYYFNKKTNYYNLPKIYFSQTELEQIQKIRKENQFPIIGLIIGVTNKLKEYPHWNLIINQLGDTNYSIFLLGVNNNLNFDVGQSNIIDLTRHSNYRDAILYMAACDIVIGAEGSLIHIASSFNKKIIVLEGSDNFYKNSFLKPNGNITILSAHTCKLWINSNSNLKMRHCFLDNFGKIRRGANQCLANINSLTIKKTIDCVLKNLNY
ncbi:hypothetical protein HZC33_01910 [Candidatus Wolfebacteria bacterium]|nr:hypothetical protein [Candidatus Wolfebacteria bacterium]